MMMSAQDYSTLSLEIEEEKKKDRDGKKDDDPEVKEKKKKKLTAISKQVNIEFLLDFIQQRLTKIVHHRNLLSNFRNLYSRILEIMNTVEVHIDFSENLTLTLPEEIQSMYWGQAKKNVTVHSGILKANGEKVYHPYISDDLSHDQEFVYTAIHEMLSDVDIEPLTTIIVTSDNCCSQYKSAQNFCDLQRLADEFDINILRIYGVAGHGKNEVDTVGGVAKIALRTAISWGKMFFSAGECISYLNEKFGSHEDPSYRLKVMHCDTLEKERERSIRYPEIKGSSKFQVIIFNPGSTTIKTAPYLCGCETCLGESYGSCDLFTSIVVETGVLNRAALRGDYLHNPTPEEIAEREDDNEDVGALIVNNNVFAIAADDKSSDTVWFIYIVDSECINHGSQSEDSFGHIVPSSQPFLRCNYLEKHRDTKKGITFKRCFSDVYVYKESIVHPLVEIEEVEEKDGLYFLSYVHYVEVLNYVQYTSMAALKF